MTVSNNGVLQFEKPIVLTVEQFERRTYFGVISTIGTMYFFRKYCNQAEEIRAKWFF